MQNILILDHTEDIKKHLKPYFDDLLTSYIERYQPLYIGMLLHKDSNYFTINLESEYLGYTHYTPLILFKREDCSFLYDDDHLVPYSSKGKQYEIWKQANIDICKEYPYVLYTFNFCQFKSISTLLKHSVLLPLKSMLGL